MVMWALETKLVQSKGYGSPWLLDTMRSDFSAGVDNEYDAMEDVHIRADASIARNLQAELDAEAVGLASGATRPPSRPGIIIGRSARPSGAPCQPTATPTAAPPARSKSHHSGGGYATPNGPPWPSIVFGYPLILLRALAGVDGPNSVSSWRSLVLEYREFLAELGFGPFLSIRYVHVWHPLVRCWVERFFHHTGTIHLSTCEMGVLPVDWSAILGIRFGGRIPPSDPVPDFEALEILGITDPAAIVGKNRPSLRISYLKGLLRREIEEPPTELRYRQWTTYFIFSCFLGNDKSTIPTPIVGMFRDIDALWDYDWGALTYGFYIRGLRRFSRRETASFLGFWQFTLYWAFEHFRVFAPSRLPAAPDSVFPLARRWDSAWIERLTVRTLTECRTTVDCIRDIDIVFQPYSSFLLERPEVGGEALVPVDPPRLMTIEDYIPRAPSDSYMEGVEAYPDLIQADGGRVMGGMAMDSHVFRSSGEVERLQSEEEAAQREGEMTQMRVDLAQSQRDLEFPRCRGGSFCCHRTEIRGAASGVPWDSPVRHFWVIFAFLDFWVELGFRGRFLTFKPGSRLLGHPAGGRSILITSYRTPPYKIVSDSIFDLRADFRVSGLSPACRARNLRPSDRPRPSHRWILFPPWRSMLGFFSWTVPSVRLLSYPFRSPRSNRVLEKYLGLTSAVLRLEIIRPEETWRKANISLDLLTKYFSRSDFPVELARDFIAGKKGWKKFRINAFKIAFAGDRERGSLMFCTQLLPALVLQSPAVLLPPSDPLSLSRGHTVTWGPAVWRPWTHCALFDGVPLPGVWGCTGYYPSLALRQFGGVQYPPRLGDLDAVDTGGKSDLKGR
uniref:Aminotransferase-like plant mobile domain-containing protein n=1 Tax=Fagus sylvatica TaxID=28930 RepID=A0A2N9F792_FAGSY